MAFSYLIALILIVLSVLPGFASTTTTQSTISTFKIGKINIHGNKVTRSKTIQQYMGLDTGMTVDSVQLRLCEKKLENTHLFSKVDLFTLKRNGIIELFIIVEEKVYMSPSGGGMWYSYKYGQKDLWLRLELGLSTNNFRGMMEDFSTSISVWDWRSVSFSWSKPLLPSDYFINIGTGVHYYPDEAKITDHFAVSSRFRVGKKLNSLTKVSIGLNPAFRKDINTVVNENSLKEKKEVKNYELFGSVFWISDLRKPYFDPYSGWLGYAELKSNHLYSGKYKPFVQLLNNYAFYHPGFFDNHKFAYRLQCVLRTNSGGPFHTIQMGGIGSVRGYADQALGVEFNADNSLLFSMEYRLPLINFPPMSIPILNKRNKAFQSLRYRIDGALIGDYGRIARKASDIFGMSNGSVENAAGIGFGIRGMFLNLERSLALDIVWGKDLKSEKLTFKRTPVAHTYIDLFF